MPVEVLPEMTIVFPKIEDLFPNAMRRKKICVDIDGVICEYDFPKIVKNFFGVVLFSEMFFAYDLADVLGVAPVLINIMFQEQVYGKPNFVTGAIETLREWKSKGYKIDIFSNRIKYMGRLRLARWLVESDIPFDSIGDGMEAYDFHIDDSPSKLMSTDSKVKLLFNQPWNERCLNITGELKRVYDWNEIRKAVS